MIRRLEVVANGLSLARGAQLAVDTTLVSPLKRNGDPVPGSQRGPGAALARAKRRKGKVYRDVLESRRTQLLVFGVEVGGRWSDDADGFTRLLARERARAVPRLLRRAAEEAWFSRWTGLLAAMAAKSFARTLLDLPCETAVGAEQQGNAGPVCQLSSRECGLAGGPGQQNLQFSNRRLAPSCVGRCAVLR